MWFSWVDRSQKKKKKNTKTGRNRKAKECSKEKVGVGNCPICPEVTGPDGSKFGEVDWSM